MFSCVFSRCLTWFFFNTVSGLKVSPLQECVDRGKKRKCRFPPFGGTGEVPTGMLVF